jgi:hypothetical protein
MLVTHRSIHDSMVHQGRQHVKNYRSAQRTKAGIERLAHTPVTSEKLQ